jgi:hypothetical protein
MCHSNLGESPTVSNVANGGAGLPDTITVYIALNLS